MRRPATNKADNALIAGAFLVFIMVIAPGWGHAQGGVCEKSPPEGAKWRQAKPDTRFPKTVFHTGLGEPRTVEDYAGKGLVLNFWATWCAPCVREMPALDALQKDRGAAMNLAVLPIGLDRGGARTIDPFYAGNNLTNLPVLVDNERKMARKIGVHNLPTTVLVNRDGMEIGRFLGDAAWDAPEMIAFLESCLNKPKK